VRPFLDVRRGDHPWCEDLLVGGGHLGRKDVDDVDAAVLESQLDERQSRVRGVPVGELGVDPDPLLASHQVGEGREGCGSLVQAVVEVGRHAQLPTSDATATRAGPILAAQRIGSLREE
jgi:hypothetical protein